MNHAHSVLELLCKTFIYNLVFVPAAFCICFASSGCCILVAILSVLHIFLLWQRYTMIHARTVENNAWCNDRQRYTMIHARTVENNAWCNDRHWPLSLDRASIQSGRLLLSTPMMKKTVYFAYLTFCYHKTDNDAYSYICQYKICE